jgi:hypothetical protein
MKPRDRDLIAAVRTALTGAVAGPDRVAGQRAFELLVAKWARSEDDTREMPLPGDD